MWKLSPIHDIPKLRGSGGQLFTEFVDALLRVQCSVSGTPNAAIATTLRVNVGDGGVDTRIDEGCSTDLTGWLRCKTAWQFKAESLERVTEASVAAEIQKPYAREVVAGGYGFRICVCDEMTAERKDFLVRALNQAAQAINKNARQCYVLSASDLADWANRFPGLVANHFGRPLTIARHWRAWQASELAVTPAYVLPPDWRTRFEAIQNHLRFPSQPSEAVLPVQGAAGVGKSRLAFEAIRQLPGATDLALVTNDDEPARQAALWLVNSGQEFAILVADECTVQGRFHVSQIVKGHEHRIRVIAIDNSGEPPPGGAPGIWLEQIASDTTEVVLQTNFPLVPAERRRAYAGLSEGYIRLAADLCRHDAAMTAVGGFGPAISSLQEYYRSRIPDKDQIIVEAIALVDRIGHSDDRAYQLELLATLTGIDPSHARQAVHRLKDAPGFVAVTPRYFYVTPQIIAEIAFHRAWRRWAALNAQSFLEKIPDALRPSFELRVRGIADLEVRSIVSAHFRQRVADLAPHDLGDYERIKPLLDLVETDPARYLSLLVRLVNDASREELLAISGENTTGHRARRGMVWMAERLASFPEYFESAELILRRLAIAETERGIGNNATGIWRQLVRMYLSGTAVPFQIRFGHFKALVYSDEQERDLALGAFPRLLDMHVSRMGTPTLVGGRIPPPDWLPATFEERAACIALVIDFVAELLAKPDPFADAGWRYLQEQMRFLLAARQLDRLQTMIQRNPVPEPLLGPWLEAIDNFLEYERGIESDGIEPVSEKDHEEYCKRVKAWQQSLIPDDFGGRLRGIVGKDIWHHSIREDLQKERSEIAPLVEEVIANPSLFESNLDYLLSAAARSSSTFGVLLGRQDPSAVFLEPVLSGSRAKHSPVLLRGYVGGLLQAAPEKAKHISEILDILEQEDPEIAVEVIAAALDRTDPGVRIPRMIRTGKLPAAYIQYLHYGPVLQEMSSATFTEALKVTAPIDCTSDRLKLAVELIGYRFRSKEILEIEACETKQTMKDILERSAIVEDGADYWWGQAMEQFVETAPEWSSTLAVAAIGGSDYSKRSHAIRVLVTIARTHPNAVMQAVGEAIQAPTPSFRWLVGSNREIIEALPVDVVGQWLSQTGIAGARRLARHLPSPFVDKNGVPLVPEVTARILGSFGYDETVFREFSIGRHNLEVTWGPLSANYQGRIKQAQEFLNHEIPAIRKWATDEIGEAEHFIRIWRKHEEDEGFAS